MKTIVIPRVQKPGDDKYSALFGWKMTKEANDIIVNSEDVQEKLRTNSLYLYNRHPQEPKPCADVSCIVYGTVRQINDDNIIADIRDEYVEFVESVVNEGYFASFGIIANMIIDDNGVRIPDITQPIKLMDIAFIDGYKFHNKTEKETLSLWQKLKNFLFRKKQQ